MKKKKSLKLLVLLLAISVTGCFCFTVSAGTGQETASASGSGQETAADPAGTARPSSNGQLHVQDTVLADEHGDPVQLRGVSTHGLTWYPEFVSADFFRTISEDWNCNLIRLAMYSEEYCGEEKDNNLDLVIRGIDAAICADMYVLVDWHILEDSDPNLHKAEAEELFEIISKKYSECPNILYEICNEPNGETNWADVSAYSREVIPVIRANDPDSVIVVGTPEFDRNLGDAVMRPLEFDNILYSLHFYAASHKEGLREELRAAHDAGLPVFITECGISEQTGNGTLDFESAASWFTYLKENSISYTVWSLSNKDETSAFFKPDYQPEGVPEDADLTVSGTWVRELIRGTDPEEIPCPAPVVKEDGGAKLRSWLSASLGERGWTALESWKYFALLAACAILIFRLIRALYGKTGGKRGHTYDEIYAKEERKGSAGKMILLIISFFCTMIYMCWRIVYSIPLGFGAVAIAANLILLAVEALGTVESLILYENMAGMREHPLPVIPEEEYPEVDVFVATYNEPEELLRRTINGCLHMKYPDPDKVHIWICDDNRRASMRALAEEMGVGYFDRPDNKGAKAGNLNAAMARTSAPYVVTLDADMIPQSDFLLRTIPYFVDVNIRNRSLPEEERIELGPKY